jgi:hypothetical protein
VPQTFKGRSKTPRARHALAAQRPPRERCNEPLRIPVLSIRGSRSKSADYELHFDLAWDRTHQFGPSVSPDWLRKMQMNHQVARRKTGTTELNSGDQEKLAEALSALLQNDGPNAKPCDWRQRVQDYVSRLAPMKVWAPPIRDFLRDYANEAEQQHFPPVILIRTNVTLIHWPFVPLEDNTDAPLSQTLCGVRLALGIADLKERRRRYKGSWSSSFRPAVAVATRMSTPLQAAEAEKIEADELVSQMRQLLAAWDPWGLSSSQSEGEPFGILVDQKDPNEELGTAIVGRESKASLIIYQGTIEQLDDTTVRCSWQVGRGPKTITFDLRKLARRNATLVVAHTGYPKTGGERDVRFHHLRGYSLGTNWISAPTALREIDALQFLRAFLHEACTNGAPVGELLRNTLLRALESPDELAPRPFMLYGDPAALLPFAERYEMRMHVTRREKSIICKLAERLENSPLIPISIRWHDEISDMDSEFLRRLEDGTPEGRGPEIWPISLCAIGRALFDTRYSSGARERLWIIQVALYSCGGNRLIVRYRPNLAEVDSTEPITQAAVRDPWLLGFGHNSFEGTLARMCFYWWSGGTNVDEILRPERFVSCSLQAKARVLGEATPFQVLLWGADYQQNALEDLSSGAQKHLKTALEQAETIDLDEQLEERLCQSEATGAGGFKLPMIFLVLTLGKAENQEAAPRAGRRPVRRRVLPPQSFFALRELQRSFCSLEAMEAAEGMPQGALLAGEPHYLRSIGQADLQVMAAFVAEALSLGLWQGAGKLEGAEAEKKAEIQSRIAEHMYLTPAAESDGIALLKQHIDADMAEKDTEKLSTEIDKAMWSSRGRFAEGAHQRAESREHLEAAVLQEIESHKQFLQSPSHNQERDYFKDLLQIDGTRLRSWAMRDLSALLVELRKPDYREALAGGLRVLRSNG